MKPKMTTNPTGDSAYVPAREDWRQAMREIHEHRHGSYQRRDPAIAADVLWMRFCVVPGLTRVRIAKMYGVTPVAIKHVENDALLRIQWAHALPVAIPRALRQIASMDPGDYDCEPEITP